MADRKEGGCLCGIQTGRVKGGVTDGALVVVKTPSHAAGRFAHGFGPVCIFNVTEWSCEMKPIFWSIELLDIFH